MTEGRGKGEEREGAREGRSPPIHIPGYAAGYGTIITSVSPYIRCGRADAHRFTLHRQGTKHSQTLYPTTTDLLQ